MRASKKMQRDPTLMSTGRISQGVNGVEHGLIISQAVYMHGPDVLTPYRLVRHGVTSNQAGCHRLCYFPQTQISKFTDDPVQLSLVI